MRAKDRIAELEDELKQRDRRIEDLRREVDEQAKLISEQNEGIEDFRELWENVVEAFDMAELDNGNWTWRDPLMIEHNKLVEQYEDLRLRHNKMVPGYNAKVVGALQPVGRPLAASPAQEDDVRKRRKAGQPLRDIAEDTGLSVRTVRSIVNPSERKVRATSERIKRQAKDKWRDVQQRRRARLPKRIGVALKDCDKLRKGAKGIG